LAGESHNRDRPSTVRSLAAAGLAKLEAQLSPKQRVFVFFAEEGSPHAEQLEGFKAERLVGPHDILVAVSFHFNA
jgi:hypothetical protein